MTFDETLEQHLNAIRTKDFAAFAETVPQQGELSLILLNGKLLDNAEDFIELNRDWFTDPDWSAQIKLVRKVAGEDLGFALVEVDYHDVDRQGQPVHHTYFLSLIFRRHEDGRWLLTHDQNTGISGA